MLANPTYVDLIVNGPYTLDVQNMGLVDENNAPDFYDGQVRVVDFEGNEIYRYEASEYADYVAEHVEPWTYLKFPYLKKRGWKGSRRDRLDHLYCATPLARLNVADRMATPTGPGGLRGDVRDLGGHPSKGLLAQHWAPPRGDGPERRDAASLLRRPEITGDEYRVIPSASPARGSASSRPCAAPSPTTTPATNGICTSANLIVGTTNNNAPIQMVTKKVAQALIQPGKSPTRASSTWSRWPSAPSTLLQLRDAQLAGTDAAARTLPSVRQVRHEFRRGC